MIELSEENIKFIRKYNKIANIFTACIGSIVILLLNLLLVVSTSEIIFGSWTNAHVNSFFRIEFIINFGLIGIIIAVLIIVSINISSSTKKLNKILREINSSDSIQDNLRNQKYASDVILFNRAYVSTVGKGENSLGSAVVTYISAIEMAISMRKIADELVSYLPETQRPKKFNINLMFIVIAILSFIPIFFGIKASLKDKNEIIKTREEVISTLKNVYQEYNPTIDDYYHNNGYYRDNVKINLSDGSIIDVSMYKTGQGKITEIHFVVAEDIYDVNNSEQVIDKLLNKVSLLYQKTSLYKNYYKDLFRDELPSFKMDEEHRMDLVQKLNNLLNGNENGRERQEQYYQIRNVEPKTAINQRIWLELTKDNNYKVSLDLEISEHELVKLKY